MYYFGYYPYGSVPFYRNYSNPFPRSIQEVENLKQKVEILQKEFEEIRDKFDTGEWRSNPEQIRTQSFEEPDLVKGLQEQINSLRSEQITAYQQLLSTFLKNEVSDRIRELQRDITPEKVLKKIAGKSSEE